MRGLSGAVPFAFFACLAMAGESVHPYWTAVAGPAGALSLVAFARERFGHARRAARAAFWTILLAPPLLTALVAAFAIAGRPPAIPLWAPARKFFSAQLAYSHGERRALAARVRTELDRLPDGAFVCAADGYASVSLIAFYAGIPDRIELLEPTGLARQLTDWRRDRSGHDAVSVSPGPVGPFPLALYFREGEHRPPFSLTEGKDPTRITFLFVGRGFSGFDTRAFEPVLGARAGRLVAKLYRAVLSRDPEPEAGPAPSPPWPRATSRTSSG